MHSIATVPPSLHRTVAGALPTVAVPTGRAAPLTALRVLANALFIMALLLINVGGTYGSGVFFAILTVMVFVSPEAAFKSLAICYLGLMLNFAFVPKSLVWTPGRIILPFLALLRFGLDLAAYRLSPFQRASYASLVFFAAVMAICSIASGWYTHIALLKILYFLTFYTVVSAATIVLRHRRADLGEWFVSLCLAAALFGVAAIALNIDGNFRALKVDAYQTVSSSGFNGAFAHPNAHAVYASLFVTFLAIVWLLSRYRQRWLVLPLMACWMTFIVWSESRTAFLATAAGVFFLVLNARPLRNRLGWKMRPNLSRRTVIGVGIAVATLGLLWNAATENTLGKSIASYIVKGAINEFDYQAQVSMERIVSSRKGLIEFSWHNFLANPLTGIGFGVAKTDAFQANATYLTAPAEKGFLPTAILEEGGMLGTAAFVLYICVFSWELLRERNTAGIVMLWTMLITNLGEMTIFSPGGAGAFSWIMVGAAMLFGDRCWTPPPVHATASSHSHTWRP